MIQFFISPPFNSRIEYSSAEMNHNNNISAIGKLILKLILFLIKYENVRLLLQIPIFFHPNFSF